MAIVVVAKDSLRNEKLCGSDNDRPGIPVIPRTTITANILSRPGSYLDPGYL